MQVAQVWCTVSIAKVTVLKKVSCIQEHAYSFI